MYCVQFSTRSNFAIGFAVLLSTFDFHDPVLSTLVVLHDSYPFRRTAADYRFFCNLRTGVYKRVFLGAL